MGVAQLSTKEEFSGGQLRQQKKRSGPHVVGMVEK
jgi:hypothetical protein